MTIILFVVDTSASMNQRTYHGMSLVDVASKAINDFVQQRKRDPNSRGDRYMLMTFEESPFHLKAGWKENQETFDSSLKCVAANQLNDISSALQNAFTMLNVNKLQAGKETYGSGRYPNLLDPTVIILISDGVSFHTPTASDAKNSLLAQISHEVSLFRRDGNGAVPAQTSLNNIKLDIPGAALTDAPYRWDQRLFSWILHFPGRQSALSAATTSSFLPSINNTLAVPAAQRDLTSLLDRYAAETGGRSFLIDNFATLQTVISYTCQKVLPGVVVEFQVQDRNVLEQILRAASTASAAVAEAPVTPRPSVTKSPASGGESENNDLISTRLHAADVEMTNIAENSAGELLTDAVMLELRDGLKQMLIVKRETANKTQLIQAMWPIPENFPLEDGYQQALPMRPVHPQFEISFDIEKTVKIPHSTVQQQAGASNVAFAIDRFDLEPSAFCDCLLKISTLYRDCSWPIAINVRSKVGLRPNALSSISSSIPCGYLKASAPNVMSLYLLPANYEKLFRILENYKPLQKPTTLFRDELFSYVSSIPFYVRDALLKYGVRGFDPTPPPAFGQQPPPQLAQLLQESVHASPPSGLSHALVQRMGKEKKDAKRIHDELVARGVVQRAHDATVPIMPRDSSTFESQTQDIWHIWKDIIEVRGIQSGFDQLERMRNVFQDLLKQQAIRIAARRPNATAFSAVPDNPFDVEREQLLLGLRKSRRALMDGPGKQTWFAESADDVDDVRHSMPSSAMSNFVEFKKTLPLMPELRGLDLGSESSARSPSFGNPFKTKQQAQRDSAANAAALGGFIDEMMIDIDLMMPNEGSGMNSNASGVAGGSKHHHHSKSKKTSVLSRSGGGRSGSGKHRGGVVNISGGVGAFSNRNRGPLPRGFVWMPSAERRKRSASVSEFGEAPLSPALSLPDLSGFSPAVDEIGASFSAPTSPMLLSLLLPSVQSPTLSSPSYVAEADQRLDAEGYRMLSHVAGGDGSGMIISDDEESVASVDGNLPTSIQASYAALVQHQDHLRTTKERLGAARGDKSLPISPVRSGESWLSETLSSAHNSAVASSTKSPNEPIVASDSTTAQRGEFKFEHSPWFYGVTLLEAKQRLRQLIRDASAHQQTSDATSSSSSSSLTTSESSILPIGNILRTFIGDDEVHLHLIVDCFNEALRFRLLALAHHIYDYFLQQDFESRIGGVSGEEHRSDVKIVAATACLLQHYVPKPTRPLLDRFQSRTAHLLPLSSFDADTASGADEDENSSMSMTGRKETKSLPQLALLDESRKMLSKATLSSRSRNLPLSSIAAELHRHCRATDKAAGSSKSAVSSQTSESSQHRQAFVQKLQTSSKPEVLAAPTTTTTSVAAAADELRALYARANQRDVTSLQQQQQHPDAFPATRPGASPASLMAVAAKQPTVAVPLVASTVRTPPSSSDSSTIQLEVLKSTLPTSPNKSSMINGGITRHSSLIAATASDEDEKHKRMMTMKFRKDLLGVGAAGLPVSATTMLPFNSMNTDADVNHTQHHHHHHHRARASTISSSSSATTNGILGSKQQQQQQQHQANRKQHAALSEAEAKQHSSSSSSNRGNSNSGSGRGLR